MRCVRKLSELFRFMFSPTNAMFVSVLTQEQHMTALIWASFHGELEQVKDLVGKLSDVNVADEVLLKSNPYSPLTQL
jgi:hypothetical protein